MFLLDTDTIIYSLKGHPGVVSQLQAHRADPMRVSVITLMELYFGAHKSQKKVSNLAKVRTIENSLPIIPVGKAEAEIFGVYKATLEQNGRPMDDFDLIIAATALANNLTLVTYNTKHFSRIEGLRLENWAGEK